MRDWKATTCVAAFLLLACGKTAREGTGGADTASGGAGGSPGDCVPIDANGDGTPDGCDTDGDGIIDVPYDDDPDDPDDDGVVNWPPPPNHCVPGIPATTQFPRLTNAQYDNTIRDLTGLDTSPSTLLAPDYLGNMTDRAWEAYRAAAVSVAEQVMARSDLTDWLIPCTGEDEACARQFIVEFGRRAYRRPLTSEETARYEALYADRARLTENGTFREAIQMLMEVFLISPSFLMLSEMSEAPEGEYMRLSDYEVATRLSYMLWNSMPDAELFAAAEQGALETPEAIRAQAERLLSNDEARPVVADFHRSYLGMGPGSRWESIVRDPDLFPEFDPTEVPAMVEEEERVFDYVVFEQRGTFNDLLMTPVGFVNETLAPLYGLDPALFGATLERVEHDPDQRPGVFTRAGFLAAYALPDRTSPTSRGAFLTKHVLCVQVPPPTPEHGAISLPVDEELSVRERVEAATSSPECNACHSLFDPTGFALEGFDATGAIQTTDNGKPIDSHATLFSGARVDSAASLIAAISTAPTTPYCYAEQWVEYAYRRAMNEHDACIAEDLAERMQYDAPPVLDLIVELTQADSFRLRARGE